MNLEKERELFEAWYLQHYYTRNGLTPDIDIFKKYHDGDDWVYLYDPTFRSWTVWLASASREGYKTVPIKCTNNMAHAAKEIDGRLSAFKYGDVWEAMLGAVDE